MKRQTALQSDDIIKPTADANPPAQSYAEIITGSKTLARVAAEEAQKPSNVSKLALYQPYPRQRLGSDRTLQ